MPPNELRYRALLVSNDPRTVRATHEGLDEAFEVVEARSGLEALENLDHFEPDLVIAEVFLPGLSGIETVSAIRKDGRYEGMPVIFLGSATESEAAPAGYFASGIEGIIDKPFAPAEMKMRVDKLIRQSRILPRTKEMLPEAVSEFVRKKAEPKLETSEPQPSRSLSDRFFAITAHVRARVLVVAAQTDTLADRLAALAEPFEVVGTSNFESAPEKIVAYEPDILVVDAAGPRLSGIQLLLLMRANRQLRVGRVLFLSPDPDGAEARRAARFKGTEILPADIATDRLSARIGEIVRQAGFSRGRKRVDYREVLRREGANVGMSSTDDM